MTLTYQRESVSDVLRHGRELFARHYNEIAVLDEPFDLDDRFFIAAEAAGVLRLFTARVGSRLIGYSVHAVARHPLCDVRQAQQVVFYVHPAWRGNRIGASLLAYADKQLAADGVRLLFQNGVGAMAAMLERAGYTSVDRTFLQRS